MRNKIFYSFIFLIIILVMAIFFSPRTGIVTDIKGSYISDENPRTMITFDSSNNGKFYYYYIDNKDNQIEVKGSFFKKQNGEYKIECKTLSIEKCKLNGKELTINIEGKAYRYVKNSNNPTFIIVQ